MLWGSYCVLFNLHQFELFINIPWWIFGCWGVLRLVTEGCILNHSLADIWFCFIAFFFIFPGNILVANLISALQVWDMAKLGQQGGSCKLKRLFSFIPTWCCTVSVEIWSKYSWIPLSICLFISVWQRSMVSANLQVENGFSSSEQVLGPNGGKRSYTLFQGHSAPVYSTTFSPLGDFILSSSADTTSTLYYIACSFEFSSLASQFLHLSAPPSLPPFSFNTLLFSLYTNFLQFAYGAQN